MKEVLTLLSATSLTLIRCLLRFALSERLQAGCVGWRIDCGVEVTESSTNKQYISSLLRFALSER
jgi:hypothetical protein